MTRLKKQSDLQFRLYRPADQSACLSLFDSNCHDFFAPEEICDYERFLAGRPSGYEVCLDGSTILGAYGLTVNQASRRSRLHWIMIDASVHGRGVGTKIMHRVLHVMDSSDVHVLDIAASQKSAPFFARFGAVERSRRADGWGVGLDRVDMELEL